MKVDISTLCTVHLMIEDVARGIVTHIVIEGELCHLYSMIILKPIMDNIAKNRLFHSINKSNVDNTLMPTAEYNASKSKASLKINQ